MRTFVFYHFNVQCVCDFQRSQSVVCILFTAVRDAREHTHIRILSFSIGSLVRNPVHSQLLDVPVLLPQDGDLVPEQHRVQPHLGVHQGHVTQPVSEDVHAGLSLGKVVRVGPPGCLGALSLEKSKDRERETIC